jgi:hypothetical protein
VEDGSADGKIVSITEKKAIMNTARIISKTPLFAIPKKGPVLNAYILPTAKARKRHA